MKDFLRSVKSEFRRIISDRKLVIITLAVLACFLVIITVFLALDVIGNPQNFTPNFEYCQNRFDYFERYYLYLTGATQESPEVFFDATMTVERAKEQMDYFAFMLKNNGESYKFLDLSKYYGQTNPNPYDVPPSSRGACAQVWIMINSFYVLTFFAVIISVLICVVPYTNGIMKNYYASPVRKSTLFAGKLATCWAVCLLFWIIVLIWGLCFGTVGEPIRVIHYNGNEYTSYNLNGVFATKMLGTLISTFFVSALTAFIGKCTKKNFISALAVIILCIVFSVLFEVNMSDGGFTAVEKCLLPIIGLRANHYIAADGGLWILYAIYVILSVALFTASLIVTDKQRKKY